MILHHVLCPRCGWPSHADQRGRMLCCTGVREKEVREDIKFKIRKRRGNAVGRTNVVPAVQSPQSQQVPSRLRTERAESVNADRLNETPAITGQCDAAKLLTVALVGENPASITPQIESRRCSRRGRLKSEFSSAENEGGDNLSLTISAGQGELFETGEK